MRKITFSLFIALLVLTTSCHKEYFDSGDFVIEYRDIDTNYTQVILDGAFDLIVTQDSSFTLKIEGGEIRLLNDDEVLATIDSPEDILHEF